MKRLVALLAALSTVLGVSVVWAEPLPTAKPEQVGLSSQRLERVGQSFKAQIERGRFPGAVAVIVRKGKIAYFETFGQLDPATGARMSKDAIFRLYSMTKPFASVAAMMLVEDGKLTLALISPASCGRRRSSKGCSSMNRPWKRTTRNCCERAASSCTGRNGCCGTGAMCSASRRPAGSR